MRQYTVDDWRRAVYRDQHITDGTRVLLLLLADHMHTDLRVSVPRGRLAKALDRSERRISERLREAVGEMPGQDQTRRLLDRVVRGQRHVTPVYQGLIPGVLCGTDGGPAETPIQGAVSRPAENADSGSLRDPRGSRLIGDQPSREVTSTAPACPWHDDAHPCDPDCRNYESRRTA